METPKRLSTVKHLYKMLGFKDMNETKVVFTPSETAHIIAGILFLASTVYIVRGGDFTLIHTAKVFYALGIILLFTAK